MFMYFPSLGENIGDCAKLKAASSNPTIGAKAGCHHSSGATAKSGGSPVTFFKENDMAEKKKQVRPPRRASETLSSNYRPDETSFAGAVKRQVNKLVGKKEEKRKDPPLKNYKSQPTKKGK